MQPMTVGAAWKTSWPRDFWRSREFRPNNMVQINFHVFSHSRTQKPIGSQLTTHLREDLPPSSLCMWPVQSITLNSKKKQILPQSSAIPTQKPTSCAQLFLPAANAPRPRLKTSAHFNQIADCQAGVVVPPSVFLLTTDHTTTFPMHNKHTQDFSQNSTNPTLYSSRVQEKILEANSWRLWRALRSSARC